MSKILLRDDDIIELLDFLISIVLDNNDMVICSKAEYLAEKLCVASNRDYMEYVNIVREPKMDLISKIKTYTEAGVILEHMHLFDELENERTNGRKH